MQEIHQVATPRMDAQRGVAITGAMPREYEDILTPECLSFVAHLARMFTPRVTELLARRRTVQARLDAGERPHFLGETRRVRESDWKVRFTFCIRFVSHLRASV